MPATRVSSLDRCEAVHGDSTVFAKVELSQKQRKTAGVLLSFPRQTVDGGTVRGRPCPFLPFRRAPGIVHNAFARSNSDQSASRVFELRVAVKILNSNGSAPTPSNLRGFRRDRPLDDGFDPHPDPPGGLSLLVPDPRQHLDTRGLVYLLHRPITDDRIDICCQRVFPLLPMLRVCPAVPVIATIS